MERSFAKFSFAFGEMFESQPMNSFDTFMTIDHRARQRVMITSVVVGAGTGLIAENLFNLSTSWAVILCLVVIGITEIVGGVL